MNAAWLALACLIGFVLLVVTTCSSPISETINLFTMSASEGAENEGGEIRAGVLGFCLFGAVNIIGGPYGLGPRTSVICSTPQLGYAIVIGHDPFRTTVQVSEADLIVGRDLTQAMVFNPIGAAIAGLTMVISLIAAYGGRRFSIAAAAMTFITMVLSWIAFGINIGISLRVKSAIDNAQNNGIEGAQNLQFSWGAASFLPVAAALVLTGALSLWAITRSWRPKAVAVEEQEEQEEQKQPL